MIATSDRLLANRGMPKNNRGSSIGARVLGWGSFALVVVAIPFSAILFTGAAILTQFLLITAGIAAAKKEILAAVLTVVVYTITAIYIAPGFFFEAFSDWTNRGLPGLIVISVLNYGVFTIGLGVGIYQKYLSSNSDYD